MVGSRSHPTRRQSTRWAIVLTAVLGLLASGCAVGATWTLQAVEPTLPASPDRIVLTDVACPADGACVAVGRRTTTVGETLVLRQAGSSWQALATPFPLSGLQPAVTCRGVDDCMLVGSPLDFHIGPAGVSVVAPAPGSPDPAGSNTMSCVASGCLRVSGQSSSWWNGTTWSTPATVPTGVLRDGRVLSCTSPTHCLLVGNDFGLEGWPTPGLVSSSVWNGTTWSTPVSVPGPTRVLDLACASPTSCFASAGVRADYWTPIFPDLPGPDVLRWNGSAWSVTPIAFTGAAPTEPPSVACAAATSCTALWVGGKNAPASPTHLGRWNGTSWTTTPTTAAATVISLGCGSATSCVAAGGPTAQQLSGSTWTTTPIPTGTSPSEQLRQVSCTSPTACTAIGVSVRYSAAGDELQRVPIIRRFDGSTWASQPTDGSEPEDLSCGGPSSCMITWGGFGRFDSRHWNGTSWQTLPPVTNIAVGAVTALTCPTADWCLAQTSDFGSASGDLAFVWSGGTSWTALPPLPSNSGTAIGASCSAPGQCVVVTDYLAPVMYRLDGSTWTMVPNTGLDVTNLGNIEDISCTGPGECVAVGTKGYDDDAHPIGLLGVLRNGTWTSTIRLNRNLLRVDCASANSCVAVGSSSLSTGAHVDRWNGSGWRDVETATGLSELLDVSCGAPGTCEVVGRFADGDTRAVVSRLVLDD